MADIEHGGSGKPWWETVEIRRLTEVTEAQSRAIEALRQRNSKLRQQQRRAVEALRVLYDNCAALANDDEPDVEAAVRLAESLPPLPQERNSSERTDFNER